jgi:hypothetical protein
MRRRARLCRASGRLAGGGCHFLLAIALLAGAPALGADLQTSAGTFFPTDPLHPNSFGLFIGIDGYPNLHRSARLHSCVHDAKSMQEFFVNQFQITQSALLTDEQATRDNIGQAMRDLVGRVRQARSRIDAYPAGQRPILNVVITYSGHGVRVQRLRTEANPTSTDPAWLCWDSTYNCDKIVRGYELLEIHQQLCEIGANVLIVSDSCHSANGYRGLQQSQARTISLDGVTPIGPQDNLFPEFAAALSQLSNPALAEDGTQPLPGFVYCAACADEQCAYDDVFDYPPPLGRQREGRFTHTLLHCLKSDRADTTYQDMAQQISSAFDTDYPDQRPEFHWSAGKSREVLLGTGPPAPDARILARDDQRHTVELSLGTLAGVDGRSWFTFYNSSKDMLYHQNSIAGGMPVDVQALNCTIQLENGATVPGSAVAEYDCPRMTRAAVAGDGAVPRPVSDELTQLDSRQQIRFVRGDEPASLVMHYFPETNTIGLYPPSRLPATRPSDPNPEAIRTFRYDDPNGFAANLLYTARVQALLSLHHDGTFPPLFSAKIVVPLGEVSGQTPPDGLTHVAKNDNFRIELTNLSLQPLYFTLIGLGQNGELQIIYPSVARDNEGEIFPHGSFEIGGSDFALTATLNNPALPPGEWERTRMKLIASSQYEDLSVLTVAPDSGMNNPPGQTRGAKPADPFFELLKSALRGGTRGPQARDLSNVVWDAANMDFDVVAQ